MKSKSNLYYSGRYKDKILSLLINSDDVVKLINPTMDKRFELDEILLGGTYFVYNAKHEKEKVVLQGHLFDSIFVPDTTDEQKVFICIETLINSIERGIFNAFSLFIHVYVSKDLVRLDGNSTPRHAEMMKLGFSGNRVDMLCDAIDRKLNGNSSFGIGDVEPSSRNFLTLSIPNDKFYGKCLQYTVKNYIDTENCDI